MTNEMMQQYTALVYFLGGALGPDYEITLYDLRSTVHSVVAIANGRISGQTIGSPLPEVAQELLSQRQYEQENYVLNFTSRLQATGKIIRSSAMFIRDRSGKPVGLLGINFDDSRFLKLSNRLLDLIHPNSFLQQEYGGAALCAGGELQEEGREEQSRPKETVHNDVTSMIQEIFAAAAATLPISPDRLTQGERVDFLSRLRKQGMFRLKGAVQYTAENLGCSQASVYRYLSKIKAEASEDSKGKDL